MNNERMLMRRGSLFRNCGLTSNVPRSKRRVPARSHMMKIRMPVQFRHQCQPTCLPRYEKQNQNVECLSAARYKVTRHTNPASAMRVREARYHIELLRRDGAAHESSYAKRLAPSVRQYGVPVTETQCNRTARL